MSRISRTGLFALGAFVLTFLPGRHVEGNPDAPAEIVSGPTDVSVTHAAASNALTWTLKALSKSGEPNVEATFEWTHGEKGILVSVPKVFQLLAGTADTAEGTSGPQATLKTKEEVRLRLPIEFARIGTVEGVLVVTQGTGSARTTLRKTYAVRFQPPALTLDGKSESETLSISTTSKDISRRMKIATSEAGRLKIQSATFEKVDPKAVDGPTLVATLGENKVVESGVLVDVLLTGTVAAPGTYELWLAIAYVGGTRYQRVEVKREPPALHFEAHAPDKPIALAVQAATTNHRLKLTLTGGGRHSVTGIEFKNVVTDFDDEGALTATFEVPVAVQSSDKIDVDVKVVLPAPGTYRGWAVFDSQDGQRFQPIVVTLPAEDGTATITDVYSGVFCTSETPTIGLTITEALGRKLDCPAPEIVSLQRNLTGNAKADAPFKTTSVEDGKGGEVSKIELERRGAKLLVMRLEEIGKPGTYSGRLQIKPTTGKPIDATFSFSVKRPLWFAALWMFLGTLVVLVINLIVHKVKPALQREVEYFGIKDRHRLLRLEAMTDDERSMLSALDSQLRKLERLMSLKEWAAFATYRDALKKKLSLYPRWANVNRLLVVVPATVRNQFHASMKKVSKHLRAREFVAADETAAGTELGNLEDGTNGVEAKAAAHLNAVADDLRSQLEIPKLRAGALPGTIDRFRHHHDEAVAGLDALPGAVLQGDFVKAARLHDSARLALAFMYALTLQSRLEKKWVPPGFEEKDWTDHRTKISKRLHAIGSLSSPEQALREYGYVRVDYWREMIARLDALLANDTAPSKLTHMISASSLDQKQKDELKAAARLAQGEWKDAPDEFETGNYEAAIDKYDAASSTVYDILRKLEGKREVEHEDAVASLRMALETAPSVPGAVAVGVNVAEELGDIDAAISSRKSKLFGIDLLLWFVAAVVAIALGVGALWADDPEWGSFSNIIAALAWGLGVTTGGQAGLAGITELRSKISGEKPAV